MPRSRFRPAPSQDAPVERLVRECALLHRASVFEDCDSAQQAGSELRPEFFPRPAAGREGHVLERPHAGLVRPLEAVNERAALDSHSARVFQNERVRGDQLRRHVELEANPVARLPAAAEGKVLARLDGAVHRLAVGGHFGAGRPSRDAEIKGEFARSLGIQSEIDVAFPRVAGLLSDLQPGAVFEAPVEIGALEEVSVDAILARAVQTSDLRLPTGPRSDP